MTDYEKAFCAVQQNNNILEMRGVNRTQGAMVVVRPDQFVSLVVPLDGVSEARDFFANVMLSREAV